MPTCHLLVPSSIGGHVSRVPRRVLRNQRRAGPVGTSPAGCRGGSNNQCKLLIACGLLSATSRPESDSAGPGRVSSSHLRLFPFLGRFASCAGGDADAGAPATSPRFVIPNFRWMNWVFLSFSLNQSNIPGIRSSGRCLCFVFIFRYCLSRLRGADCIATCFFSTPGHRYRLR